MKVISTRGANRESLVVEHEEWLAICVFLDLCANYLAKVENEITLNEDEISTLAHGDSLEECRPDRLAALGGFMEGAVLANLDLRGELDWIWTDGVHLCVRLDEDDMDEVIVTVEKVMQFAGMLFRSHGILVEEAPVKSTVC